MGIFSFFQYSIAYDWLGLPVPPLFVRYSVGNLGCETASPLGPQRTIEKKIGEKEGRNLQSFIPIFELKVE